jgi:hypothetical protein
VNRQLRLSSPQIHGPRPATAGRSSASPAGVKTETRTIITVTAVGPVSAAATIDRVTGISGTTTDPWSTSGCVIPVDATSFRLRTRPSRASRNSSACTRGRYSTLTALSAPPAVSTFTPASRNSRGASGSTRSTACTRSNRAVRSCVDSTPRRTEISSSPTLHRVARHHGQDSSQPSRKTTTSTTSAAGMTTTPGSGESSIRSHAQRSDSACWNTITAATPTSAAHIRSSGLSGWTRCHPPSLTGRSSSPGQRRPAGHAGRPRSRRPTPPPRNHWWRMRCAASPASPRTAAPPDRR